MAFGPFMVAYALLLGAGSLSISFLNSLSNIGSLLSLFAVPLLQKKHFPKKTVLLLGCLSAPFYLLGAGVGFMHPGTSALLLLLFSVAASNLSNAFSGSLLQPWMKTLIPQKIVTSFFAKRFQLIMLFALLCNFFGWAVIRFFEKNDIRTLPYSILLFLAFFVNLLYLCLLRGVKDVAVEGKQQVAFAKQMKECLKNKTFTKALCYLSALNFSKSFLISFLTVFMIKGLDMQMSLITIVIISGQIAQMAAFTQWAKKENLSNFFLELKKIVIVFVLGLVLAMFTIFSKANLAVICLLFVTNAVFSVAQAGLTLSTNNIPLLIAPKENPTIYLSFSNILRAVVCIVGTLCGGVVLSFLEKMSLNTHTVWFLFFVLSSICFIIEYLFLIRRKYV